MIIKNNSQVKILIGEIKPRRKYIIEVQQADGTFNYQFILRSDLGSDVLGMIRDTSKDKSFTIMSQADSVSKLYLANFPGCTWTEAEISLREVR